MIAQVLPSLLCFGWGSTQLLSTKGTDRSRGLLPVKQANSLLGKLFFLLFLIVFGDIRNDPNFIFWNYHLEERFSKNALRVNLCRKVAL
jgi:hypothetical protein